MIPKSPIKPAKSIITKRKSLKVRTSLNPGIAKEVIPVKATIITMAGETSPAMIAASPTIKAPTMLIA